MKKIDIAAIILSGRYMHVGWLNDHACYVAPQSEQYGILSLRTGRLLLPCTYLGFDPLWEQYVLVREMKGTPRRQRQGVFDTQRQKMVMPTEFIGITHLVDDVVIALRDRRRNAYSMRTGKELIPRPNKLSERPLTRDCILLQDELGRDAIYSTKLHRRIPDIVFKYTFRFSDSLARITNTEGTKDGVFSLRTHKIVLPPEFDGLEVLNDSMILCQKGNVTTIAVIDRNGNVIHIEPGPGWTQRHVRMHAPTKR